MELRQGNQLIGTIDSLDDLRVGADTPAFIFKGDEVVSPNPIKDGLVLWYDFKAMSNDFDNRGVAKDLSGNGNHGTLQNFNYTAESGYQDGGLKFDGVDDFTRFEEATEWTDTGKITAELVFSTTNTDSIQVLLSNNYVNFEIDLRSDGGIQFYYSDGSSSNYRQPVTSGNFNDGNLHHIVVIFHKDLDTVVLYHNGEEIYSVTNSAGLDMTGFSANNFELGRRPDGRRSFVGDIYSIRIYNRPLTPEEIQHNYQIEEARFNLGGDDL